jgi:hypothetical protein
MHIGEDRCVTLVANNISLALEAQSAAYLAAWLPALDQLLQTFGRMQPSGMYLHIVIRLVSHIDFPLSHTIDDVSDSSPAMSPTLTTPATGGGFAAALGIASVTLAVKGDTRRYSIAVLTFAY